MDIPALFVEDLNDPGRYTPAVNPECAWVAAGRGTSDPAGAPRTFFALWRWFGTATVDRVVWTHDDGRQAQVEKAGFR